VLYGGFMGEREARVSELMVRQLLASLRDEKADLLSWSGVQTPSELREILHRAPGVLCRDYLARSSEHWRMKMPASLDEFLEKRMNKKHRYWAKRLMRMLEKDFPGQVRYECFSKPDQMDTLFADTVRVAKKTYQWGLGVGFQDIPENRERLKLAAERGWLRAYLLYLKNEPVAFWLCTVYGDTVHLDFTGYDPELRKYEVGTALFLHMLGDMAQQRVENLDFGLGSASYKERFGDSSFSESVVCAFASSGRGVFLSVLRLVLQGPAELMRGLLLRLNLEQKAKRLWRTYVTPVRSEKQPSTAEL